MGASQPVRCRVISGVAVGRETVARGDANQNLPKAETSSFPSARRLTPSERARAWSSLRTMSRSLPDLPPCSHRGWVAAQGRVRGSDGRMRWPGRRILYRRFSSGRPLPSGPVGDLWAVLVKRGVRESGSGGGCHARLHRPALTASCARSTLHRRACAREEGLDGVGGIPWGAAAPPRGW